MSVYKKRDGSGYGWRDSVWFTDELDDKTVDPLLDIAERCVEVPTQEPNSIEADSEDSGRAELWIERAAKPEEVEEWMADVKRAEEERERREREEFAKLKAKYEPLVLRDDSYDDSIG